MSKSPAVSVLANTPHSYRGVRLSYFVSTFLVVLLSSTFPLPAQITTQTNYNPRGYDASLILNAIEHPHKDLVVVIGHRGAHALINGEYATIPENSLQSVRDAASAGWEAVEIDVKNTSDGIPILTHDYTWGRELCGMNGIGTGFNPFRAPGFSPYNDNLNPQVNSTPIIDTRAHDYRTYLRDSISIQNNFWQGCSLFDGNFYTGEYAPTLEKVLNEMKNDKIEMALTLDIKDAATAAAAWQVLNRVTDSRERSYSQLVIIKVPGRNFKTTALYDTTFPSLGHGPAHVFPYYNTGDIKPTTYGSETEIIRNIGAVEADNNIRVSVLEIVKKQYNGILTQTLDYVKGFFSTGAIGNFSPYGERTTPANPNVPEFFTNNGYCAPCDTLATYYYNGAPNNQPSDTDDQRGSKEFLVNQGFNVITADDTADFIHYLTTQGLHETKYFSPPGAASNGGQLTLDGAGYTPQPKGTYTLLAIVSSPAATGTVTFYENGTPLGTATLLNGSTSFTVASIASGAHTYTATYSGDGSYPPATSNTFSVTPGGYVVDGGSPQDPAAPARTFTVNAGGTSFTTTQPNDSVATYTWFDGGQPSEALTTASGSGFTQKLQSVPLVKFANASDTITVNTSLTYQTMDGFGGAMTDSAASLIAGSTNRDTIMGTLFGNNVGQAGLTIVRSPMGSSDLMADPNDFHTYEDTQGSFSANAFASDQRQIDMLTQAKSLAGSDFKLLGTPWSAPGWMKRGGLLRPAQCGTDQNELDLKHVTDYANYFNKYVSAYNSLGLKPWMVSMGNEPENCKTAMPTTLLSGSDEVILAQELRYRLPADVKVLGWDHNWNDKDFVNTLTGQTSGRVDAIGYHCYDGTHYGNQTQAVDTYFTECSGFTDQSSNVAANMGFEVANTLIGPLRNGSRGSLYWTLAQDPNGNPHLGGTDACQNCRGMITVNADGSFQPSQDFYFWAQFSKFVRPGAVRVDSNNSGDLSTVAFHNGNQTTLVVLNSSTHADGGSAGSDERDLRGHIVQWNGDTAAQKAAWLVGADGYRRWISDGSTFNCLKYDAGMQGPDSEASGALDKYINMKDVWAVCGATVMGTRSELEVGTYLKSPAGARLTLTPDGLRSIDSSGTLRWSSPVEKNGTVGPGSGLTGDRLILQEDQNLVLYAGLHPIWSSGTVGSGAIFLVIRDDGTFALFNKQNQKVWVSPIDATGYKGMIVQWDGDTAAQKTSWQVGSDGNRRVIHDLSTFQCLHDAGAGNSMSVSSDVLDKLPDLTGIWAACGTDRIGVNGTLEKNSHLSSASGRYFLKLTDADLVLTDGPLDGATTRIWDSLAGGSELILQSDGNLVEYTPTRSPTWSSGTNGDVHFISGGGGWLFLGDDGVLSIFNNNNNQAIWNSKIGRLP